MGVGAGLYMYVVVVQKFTFAISSPDEFLLIFNISFLYFHWTTAMTVPSPTIPTDCVSFDCCTLQHTNQTAATSSS